MSIGPLFRLSSCTSRVPQGGEESEPASLQLPAPVTAFHGGKGGTGTTTLLAESASLMAASGYRVVVLDLDLYRGTAHFSLDVPVADGTHTIADLLPVLEEFDDRLMENALSPAPCGAYLLPSPRSSEEADLVRPSHAASLIEALRRNFDMVLIDTGASLTAVALCALENADRAVLVITPEIACIGAALKLIGELRARGIEPLLVVNRSLGERDLISNSEIESFLGLRTSAVLPEETVRCRRLCDEGLFLNTQKCALGTALRSLPLQLGVKPEILHFAKRGQVYKKGNA